MEFVQACAGLGVRPIVGSELTVVDAEANFHLTLLVESATGWHSLCRLLTEAHAEHAPASRPRPPPPLAGARFAARARRRAGLSLRLRGLRSARERLGARRPATGGGARAAARRRLRARALPDRAAAAAVAPRPRAQPLAGGARRAPRRRLRRDRQRALARPPPGRAPGRARRRAHALDARGVRALAPGQRELGARAAGGDGGALCRAPGRGRRDRAARGAAALRPPLRARLPLSGLRGPRRRPGAGRDLPRAARAPLRRHQRAPRGDQAPRGGAAGDPRARALGVLLVALRPARARPRGRRRGSRARLRPAPAAPRAGPRLERELGRLLPDRALPRRPRARGPLPRSLLKRRDHRDARHRPRLPARYPRAADPARPRPLRARARGAGLGLRQLSLARRRPRPGQGARAAGVGDRARRRGRRRLHPRHGDRARRRRGDRRRARVLAALALPGAARAGGLGAAAAHLPAPGRDGALDQAADRHLPGAAGGDGGPPGGPVGQGLLRRRGLSEDRPARPRDAVGGRALRRADRRGAQRAHRPHADPARRPADLRGDQGGGDDRRVPDREPGPDADAAPQPPGDDRRRDRPGGARAAGADPGWRRPPLPRAPQAAARGPEL